VGKARNNSVAWGQIFHARYKEIGEFLTSLIYGLSVYEIKSIPTSSSRGMLVHRAETGVFHFTDILSACPVLPQP